MPSYARPLTALVSMICLVAGATLAAGLDRAKGFFDAGNYAEAEGELRQVVGGEPDNVEAQRLLGLALVELERYDEAATILGQARERTPEDPGVLIGLARVEISRRSWDKALPLLDKACAIEAENPKAYFYRGIVRARRSEFAAAVADLEKTLSLKPDMAQAHYYAGLAYNGLKRPDKMVEHFQIFLKLEPDAPEAARVRSLLRSLM